LTRQTSTPAAINCRSISNSPTAGPSVATILTRRSGYLTKASSPRGNVCNDVAGVAAARPPERLGFRRDRGGFALSGPPLVGSPAASPIFPSATAFSTIVTEPRSLIPIPEGAGPLASVSPPPATYLDT
jgi:hypothetical protein